MATAMIARRQYRGGYQFAGLVELARELRKKQKKRGPAGAGSTSNPLPDPLPKGEGENIKTQDHSR
jgi:hypothetical protein